jgi:hypothetical protein
MTSWPSSKVTTDLEADDSSLHSLPESNVDYDDNDKSTSREDTNRETSSSDEVAIGKEESAQVFRLRLLVLLAIFSAAVAVSLVVYFLTSNGETDEFETQFEGASTKILNSFAEIVDRKLAAIGSLAVQASLDTASRPNVSWPFVTLSDYQLRASVTRELSGSLFVRLVPVVTDETRAAWEKYSVENLWWLDEAKAYNEEKGLGFTRRRLEGDASNSADRGVNFSSGIGDKIYMFDETFTPTAMPGPGPYFPLWMESPTFNRDLTNFDTMDYPDYAPYMMRCFETGEMSIGGLDTAPPGNTTHPDLSTSYFALLESMDAGVQVDYMGDPMSSVFFPVFEDFNAKDRKVVAIFFAVFKWAFYFEKLLPPHFPGLILVLENNCDGPFTYKVVGEEVEYLGVGDLSQNFTRRPDMVRSVDFGSSSDIGEGSTLGVKLNQDICSYKLRVYPSQELEDEYMTFLPLGVTLAVAMVFVLTAIVFLVFNRYVERRQTLVLEQAVKSTAIVTSLFPEAVRDRLMAAEYASGKTRLKSFVDGNEEDARGQPIADLCKSCHFSSIILLSRRDNLLDQYCFVALVPYCTVFFGDIAGFTVR